jgi:hypothetical protein
VTKSSLMNPLAGSNGLALVLAVALAAALLAALVASLVFGTNDVGAQAQSVNVQPSTINLDQVAQGGTEQTTIKINNEGSETDIGGINFSGSGAELVKLVDQSTDEEFVVDAVTGLLKLKDPVTGLLTDTVINLQEGQERVFTAVFSFADGADKTDIGGILEFVDADPLTNTVIDTVTVQGKSRQCTVEGTEGDDPNLTDLPGETVICGFGGNDTINASLSKDANGGKDVILGGPGNDTINMKDGVRKEYANGGSGKDLCKPKDQRDKTVSCGKSGKRT